MAGERISLNSNRGFGASCCTVRPYGALCGIYRFSGQVVPQSRVRGIAQQRYRKAEKEGIEVTESIEEPLFFFLGDTTTAILEEGAKDAQAILICPTVIIECSFPTEE